MRRYLSQSAWEEDTIAVENRPHQFHKPFQIDIQQRDLRTRSHQVCLLRWHTSLTTHCDVEGTDRLEPEPPRPLNW